MNFDNASLLLDDGVGYSIAWEQRDCTVRYTHKATFTDLLEAVIAIHADPDFSILKRLVHDLRPVREIDTSGKDASILASHALGARFTNPGLLTAVVSDREDVAGYVQCFNGLTRLSVVVLDDKAALQHWLVQTKPLPGAAARQTC